MPKPTSDVTSLERLVTALTEADSLPFLFVGSGTSIRYLGHESWRGLLEWAADLVGRPVEYYLGLVNGDFPSAASRIAEDFYETWWSDATYVKSRDKWKNHCTTASSPLKIEIASHLGRTRTKDKALAEELSTLQRSQVDGIITTNYDALLEEIFPDFEVFVGQEDLLLRRSYQMGEIYKIHGSIEQPETMILCADDYERFADESAYLVAKLISVFVEHPIIFLGYSLTDRNIRVVMTSLVRCLKPERIAEFKYRFVFVDFDPAATDPVVADHVMDLGEGRMLPVLRCRTASYKPVFDVLSSLERVVPVGLLRRVQESVVEIVRSSDPTKQIKVVDLIDLKDLDDIDVVVGVGQDGSPAVGQEPKSFVGYDRHDLIEDVLLNTGLDASQIVTTTLPIILKQTPTAWTPVFKFVADSGLRWEELPPRVVKALKRDMPSTNYPKPVDADDMTLKQMVKNFGLTKALNIALMQPKKVTAAALRKVLVENIGELSGPDANLGTAFGKAAVLLDRLENESRIPKPAAKSSAAKKPSTRSRVTKATVAAPEPGVVRSWAREQGLEVGGKGPIPAAILDRFAKAHGS